MKKLRLILFPFLGITLGCLEQNAATMPDSGSAEPGKGVVESDLPERDWDVTVVPNGSDAFSVVMPHDAWGDQRGLYLIWLSNSDYMLNVPIVRGGQIFLQWQDMEPQEGKYNWNLLDRQLKALHDKRIRATVQVNGNRKPNWLFDKIPYYPGKISEQVNDKKGSLMWWHPEYISAYCRFIKEYAAHINESPYKDAIMGVRMNFNPFGTEHFNKYPPQSEYPDVLVDPEFDKWIVPSGDRTELRPLTEEVIDAYKEDILQAFVAEFATVPVQLFMRYNVPDHLITGPVRDALYGGKMGIFLTNTRAEPENGAEGAEGRYLKFIDLCKMGITYGYSETFSNCFGEHGSKPVMKVPPVQFNYWTYLMKMNMGVSYMAVYASDFRPAIDGWNPLTKTNDPQLINEFRRTFEFAAKYAGAHEDPEHAPGAWIAFREASDVILSNPQPEGVKYPPLEVLTEDYSVNVVRKQDKTTGLLDAGPDNQRFGPWARFLPASESMQFVVHPDLLNDMAGKECVVRVTYLDKGKGEWTLTWDDFCFSHKKTDTGRWQTVRFTLTPNKSENPTSLGPIVRRGMLKNVNKSEIEAAKTDIELAATEGNTIFHMLEISKN